MGRAIAVMKQHGFHEPAVVNGLSPKHPLMVEALALGIDIEKTLATAKDSGSGNTRGKQLMLQAEIRAVKTARMTKDWAAIESPDLRQRVRAIQAEKQRNDMQHEAAMLKERLKQADNGAGDWVEEREALLSQIASLGAKTAELTEESAGYAVTQTILSEDSRIQELQEQNARQADSIQDLQAQLQEAQQGLAKVLRSKAELTEELAKVHVERGQAQKQVRQALETENMELNVRIDSLQTQLQDAQQVRNQDSELIQQLEAKIKGWEEAFKENTASYAALQKDYDRKLYEYNSLREEIEGYRAANRKLVDANEHLQEQLDSADQREALPDEVQWLRSQVSVLIEKLR